MLKVIIIGFGTIGKGVTKAIDTKFKDKFKVVAIVEKDGSLVNEKGLELSEILQLRNIKESQYWTENTAIEILNEIHADIAIEVTPTNLNTGEPGTLHIKEALKNNIHVVTSNKGPLALYYKELTQLADKKGLFLLFEATVGGAIPVLVLSREALRGDKIVRIKGILNGTTNYILSRMTETGASFNEILQEAKEAGIAERDPTLDIEGLDTAAKLVILANALMKRNVTIKDVKKIIGIREITPEALKLAKNAGYFIKLIGEVNEKEISVAPRLIKIGTSLAVGGTLNAIKIETDLAKEITLVGYGAGQMETTSAIINDMLTIYRNILG